MYDDPGFGVLDRWSTMYDVPNVVVCDSSCFTTAPEKYPTLIAMAVARRAADRLARGELLIGRPAIRFAPARVQPRSQGLTSSSSRTIAWSNTGFTPASKLQ